MTNKKAYQIKSVSTNKIGGPINTAADQLNGKRGAANGVQECVPPGYAKVVYVNVELMSTRLYDKSNVELIKFLKRTWRDMKLCPGGKAAVDELVITNRTGVHRWTKDQFRAFDPTCTQ